MIKATLKAPDSKRNRQVESKFFKSLGAALYDAKAVTIATQQAGVWRAPDGAVFISIDFDAPVMAFFQNHELNQEDKYGPFPKLRIINGGIWGLGEVPELVARFDNALAIWHMMERPAAGMPELLITGS
jgi:hypothetical protein